MRNQIYDTKIESFANFTLYTPGVNNLTDWTDQEIAGIIFIIFSFNGITISFIEFTEIIIIAYTTEGRSSF
jgi:hypothetical protein